MTHRLASVVLSLLTVMTVTVVAQTTSRLDGRVTDPNKAVIPGAAVTITNMETNVVVDTKTTDDQGFFVFAQVPVGTYRIEAEAAGFKKGVVGGVKVDVALPTTVSIVLEVGSVTEVVEVTASEGQAVINTVNAELNTVVTQRQILDLPLVSRNPVTLAGLQAGVASASGATSPRNARINGLRGSYNNITHDGINVQDNLVRTGGLFALTTPSVDNTAEFSITTQGAGTEAGTGVAQVRLVTPSGGNELHGSAFWFHRNDVLDANSFFNNAASLERPKLIRNQFGGRASGPIVKDRLFYFGFLEIFRQRTDSQISRNVMTAPIREGLFTYARSDNGERETVNLLELAGGAQIDPFIKRLIDLTPLPNDPTSTDPNIQRFRFNSGTPSDSENWSFRIDYSHTQNHNFEVVWQSFHSRFPNDTFNDIGEPFPGLIGGGQASLRQRFTAAWRASFSSSITNELRWGFQRAPVAFTNKETFADGFIVNGQSLVSIPGPDPFNPIRTFQPQGRNTPVYELIDNASWVKGNHSIRFGGNHRWYHSSLFNNAGIIPDFDIGFGTTNNVNPLTGELFPGGIGSSDFSRATGYLALLTGSVTDASQRFNVSSRTSGFVPDVGEDRTVQQNILGLYVGDTWRLRPNFTLNFGLRYERYTPVDESEGLALLPTGGAGGVLNPNDVVDFAGGPSGSFYDTDGNDLAPNISFAWDPFKDGRTSIRAGYSISYVIDSNLTVVRNAFRANSGLSSTKTIRNLSGTVSGGGIVTITPPEFKVPRTLIDNLVDFSSTSGAFTIDRNLRTPYVQQWSLSIEREIFRDTAVEIRYVGNRGTKLTRAIDFNQLNPFGANGQFLEDFKAAQRNLINNGDPYEGEPVPTFDLLGGRGFLNSFRSRVLNGEVGQLILLYLANRNFLFVSPDPDRFAGGERFGATVGADFFFPNGNILFGDVVGNGSYSTYHGLQLEIRRRFSDGLYFQANYTYSKNLTDFNGSQSNFDAFMDINRPQLEKRRATTDITQVFNANFVYELPFGPGKRFLSRGGVAGKIFGGWQLGGIVNWQSGEPVSIISGRGTFNRTGRSENNTAVTSLTIDELKQGTGLFHLPDGRPVLFDPRFLNLSSSGSVRGANTDLFQNPEAGEVGGLGLTPVSGPRFFNMDFSIIKRTNVTETQNVEFRAEFFNIFNHTNFNVGQTQNINSSNFGAITSTFPQRIIQFALRYNF